VGTWFSGSGGVVAVLGFSFREPYELHGRSLNDWGVNVAFTEKLISKSVVQSIVWSKRFYDIYKVNQVMKYRHVFSAFKDAENLARLRHGLHVVFAGLSAYKRSGIVVIDLPVLSIGLEVSAFITGTNECLELLRYGSGGLDESQSDHCLIVRPLGTSVPRVGMHA
jgi:hypothetical protein